MLVIRIIFLPKFSKKERFLIIEFLFQKKKPILKFKNEFIYCKKYSGLIKNSTIDKKINTIDIWKKREIYLTYKKVKEAYEKCRDIYVNAKKSNLKTGIISGKQQEYQKQEQNRTQEFQDQQQQLLLQRLKIIKAFQRYGQLKDNKTMNLSEKQVEINNHLNYMLNNGFITPAQKQQLSNTISPETRK